MVFLIILTLPANSNLSGVSYTKSDAVWRFPIAFQIVFAIIMIVFMTFLPESPRWYVRVYQENYQEVMLNSHRLLSKDLDEEGTAVIAALNGEPIDSHIVQVEKRVILDSMAATGEIGNKASYRDLFTNGKTQHFRRMIIGASSQLMQQIGGYGLFLYFVLVISEMIADG